jgi:hypothetical protein
MRFSTLLEELSATLLYLFVLFVCLLILMDLILVRWLSLVDVSWKHVDYVSLGAAAPALIGSSGKVDQFLSERYAQYPMKAGEWSSHTTREHPLGKH